jgi:hypothetical protein
MIALPQTHNPPAQQPIQTPVAHVLAVDARRLSWLRRDRHTRFTYQLAGRFIETHHRALLVERERAF